MDAPRQPSLRADGLEAQVDALLALDASDRDRALEQLAALDADHASQLRSWLDAGSLAADLLDANRLTTTPPERVGPWVLLQLLENGAHQQTWLGRRADGSDDLNVAVRVFSCDRENDWHLPELRQSLTRLQHPNICALLDGGAAPDGRAFLVSECFHGLTLQDWLQLAAPSVELRIAAFLAIADALAHAHEQGLTHGCLQPAKVLVTAQQQVKLLDFGLASALGHAAAGASEGPAAARLAYAAPEQFCGAAATAATDQYALGLLLYLLLTDSQPEDTAHLSMAELQNLRLHTDTPAPSARARPELIPAEQLRDTLDVVVLRCLQRDPGARYPDVRELIAAVQVWQAQHPAAVHVLGGWRRLSVRLRQHARALALTSLIACLLLIGLGSAIWQVRQAQTLVGQERAINLFLSQLIYAGDERVLTSTARDLRSTLTAALAHIEGQSLGASADARVLTLLARGLLAQDAYAAAARALALAEQRVGVAPDAGYVAEHAMLQAQLALAALDYPAARAAIARARRALAGPYDPDELALLDARLRLREADDPAALGVIDQSIATRATRYGQQDARTLMARIWRLEGLRLSGDAAQSIEYGVALLNDLERALPAVPGLTPAVLLQLAHAHIALHDAKARPYELDIANAQLQQSLLLALPLYGEHSLVCIDVRTGLAEVLRIRGDVAAYRRELGQVLEGEIALFGPGSARVAQTQAKLTSLAESAQSADAAAFVPAASARRKS